MGSASSTVYSGQSAELYLTQQFSGTCNVVCQNMMSGITIDLINSPLTGGISLTQSCSTNAQCLVSSNMDAMADVILKASNTASAEATSLITGQIGSSNVGIQSRQDIKESIVQQNNESCQISSVNQMNDVTIYAQNSSIQGGISLDQEGNAQGSCSLSASTSAAASALGESTNTGMSGKGANKKLGMEQKKGATMTRLTYIIALIVIGVIVYSIAKMITGGESKKERRKQEAKAQEALAKAGCPGGLEPIKDKKGKVVFNPYTKRPVCPPFVPPSLMGEKAGTSSGTGSSSTSTKPSSINMIDINDSKVPSVESFNEAPLFPSR